MSDYGNLVMEDSQGKFVWKSNPGSSNKDSSPYQLKLENDGTLNILDKKANTIWSSLSNSIGLLNCYNMIFIKKYLFLI